MASEAAIILIIDRIVDGAYSAWTVGVTDDPARRKAEHGSPRAWHDWEADTEQAARNVESHFIARGMKGGPGGLGRADNVYMF